METPDKNKLSQLPDAEAKRYNKIKIRISIIDMILSTAFISVLAFSGIARIIVQYIEPYSGDPYFSFLLFLAVVGVISSVMNFPLDFYSGYLLEHRFNLSTQNIFMWALDKIKSFALSLAFGIPVALAFFYFLRMTGVDWWLYFGVFVFCLGILIARLAPIIIFPIFYKFEPLSDDIIIKRITDIVSEHKIEIKGIFTFNLSKETKKANAAFTGIGKSKRIILSDTLIQNFTPDEIAVIFAHEVGHYKKRHIAKNIMISGLGIFVSLFLCSRLYDWTLVQFGFFSTADIAAIPILFFYLTIFGIITMPLLNALSRHYEIEADRFTLQVTGDRDSFISSMEKLAKINLADKDPGPITEIIFYSHPSIKKRIAFAKKNSSTQDNI